jgi:hypothetical protein
MQTLRNITRRFLLILTERFREAESGVLSNDCKLSIILTISSTETYISKAINDASVQGIYKLPHSWITITTAVTTNSPKCVLKGILVQISGVEALPLSLSSTQAGQQ